MQVINVNFEKHTSILFFLTLQITKAKEALSAQLEEKGKALMEYKEKHNIRFSGEGEKGKENNANKTETKVSAPSGVLVADK